MDFVTSILLTLYKSTMSVCEGICLAVHYQVHLTLFLLYVHQIITGASVYIYPYARQVHVHAYVHELLLAQPGSVVASLD